VPFSADAPTLVTDRTPLKAGDAVAALIVVDGGGYLMQSRDDVPGIWYPGHWGCFGGAVDPGETPEEAFRRELIEEIGVDPDDFVPFVGFDFDLRAVGQPKVYRNYYVMRMTAERAAGLTVHEGRELRVWDPAPLLALERVVPYDAFALWLHLSRDRLS